LEQALDAFLGRKSANIHLPWRSIRNFVLSRWVPVFAVICPARILSAQQPDAQASITGTVFDSNGSLVRDAEITAKNQTTGAVSNGLSGVYLGAETGRCMSNFAATLNQVVPLSRVQSYYHHFARFREGL
jgi:hypothetical protein